MVFCTHAFSRGQNPGHNWVEVCGYSGTSKHIAYCQWLTQCVCVCVWMSDCVRLAEFGGQEWTIDVWPQYILEPHSYINVTDKMSGPSAEALCWMKSDVSCQTHRCNEGGKKSKYLAQKSARHQTQVDCNEWAVVIHVPACDWPL